MFGHPVRMKCGHIADTIMTDVPYNGEMISVAACSNCFNHIGTAIQPACNMDNSKQESPLPKIERDYTLPILGVIACLTTLIFLIVSL